MAFSLVSFVLLAASLALGFAVPGLPLWTAPAVAFAGWFSGFVGVKKVTHAMDIISCTLSGWTLGFLLDHSLRTSPYFFVSIVLISLVFVPRTAMIQTFGYVKMPWYEPLTGTIAIAFYVYANLHTHAGWMGWAFPAPLLGFAVFMAMGSVKDAMEYAVAAKKEYAIEEAKPAPGFSLPDHNGKTVTLAEFSGKQLVLLLFVRGDWCPSCHIMLRVYEKHVEKFRDKNVLVMAIGPDPVGVNREMVKKLNLDYRILADDRQEALRAYGIQYQESNPGAKYEIGIPMPASILVDKKGIVRYISRADRAGEFLNPMKIFSVLETLEA